MMLGPSGTGEYNQSKVMSIRRNRAPCRLIKAGQSATLALSGVDKAFIRRVSKKEFKFIGIGDQIKSTSH